MPLAVRSTTVYASHLVDAVRHREFDTSVKSLHEADAVADEFWSLTRLARSQVLQRISISKTGHTVMSHYLFLRVVRPNTMVISHYRHLEGMKLLQLFKPDEYKNFERLVIR